MERLISATTLLTLAVAAAPATAQTLRGSRASVEKQYAAAVEHDFSFLRSASEVKRFASRGLLVPLSGNANYELAAVSFPFARPAVKTFVERLARQYRSACGEELVVTSLTRPTARQPRNASDQSVHPAGMAVDLRISRTSKCRKWLEGVLVSLEARGVLEATRERFPAHFHVAVFPSSYLAYIGQPGAVRLARAQPAAAAEVIVAAEPADGPSDDPVAVTGDREVVDSVTAPPAATATLAEAVAPEAGPEPAAPPELTVYRVNRGDTLWSIARQHGLSVAELKDLNGLGGSRIKAGQRLKVPTAATQ